MLIQAEELVKKAEQYHIFFDGSNPEFINELIRLVDNSIPIENLKNQYLRIISQSPENIVKIIPENINKYDKIEEFILCELVSSCDDVLTYINSIEKIKLEDKYTDLLLLSLNGRLKQYFWKLGNQRGGYSATSPFTKNPGELDFAICDSGNRKLAICEALILEGKNSQTTTTHNLKIFNYTPDRKLFFIIVYYLGNRSKFNANWKNYSKEVIPKINFPENYEMTNSFQELPEFGTDTIKVGKAIHNNETLIFHIYINVNYRI